MEEPKVRGKERKDEAEKAAGAAVPLETEAEREHDPLQEELLLPKPPVKSKGRGGTGIGRDLDH
jgi:hypothetical protein